jgi:hypothetical protein
MKPITSRRRYVLGARVLTGVAATFGLVSLATNPAPAGNKKVRGDCGEVTPIPAMVGLVNSGDSCGTWTWQRSPDEEKRVVIGLYNRYCLRCHGVDGRGVWDIPGVPDFTNSRWQASRSDTQLVRIILEGRGAVMPPFRGTMTLEESWGMARYIRALVPGTETPKPDLGGTEKPKAAEKGTETGGKKQ